MILAFPSFLLHYPNRYSIDIGAFQMGGETKHHSFGKMLKEDVWVNLNVKFRMKRRVISKKPP